MCAGITMQLGVRLPVTLNSHAPKICIEGNRFLLTGFQLWGAESTPALSPPLPQDPELLAPLKATSQKTPHSEVPHVLICP